MSDDATTAAWGTGLATVTEPGGRILDVLFPEPRLGLDGAPHESGTRESGGEALPGAGRTDELRGVRTVAVTTVIADLSRPPEDTPDAYLRLHLLSHRLVRPRGLSLDGVF